MREGKAAEYLGAELESLVLHGRVALPPWPDGGGWEYEDPHYDDTEASQGTGGSNNWPVEAWGSRYTVDFKARGWNREKESRDFFAKAKQMFQGKECDSTIYGYMQGHAVLQVAHVSAQIGATETHQSAMRWLEYLAARCELVRSRRTGRILTCGDRSAALLGPGEPAWQDHFANLGMERRQPPKSEKILRARADIVRRAFARLRAGASPLDLMRELGFRTLVPLRVVESARTKTVFRVGSNWHGSTQPVAIGHETDGVELYAPQNRGYTGNPADKTHRKPGTPTVTEHPDHVLYQSPVYRSPLRIPLPMRGDRTLDVEVGGPDFVRDLRSTTPPAPPAPEPPDPPNPTKPKPRHSWLERMGL